jgi:hypothetical protein
MQEKKAVARQIRSCYQKTTRKEKSAILDEFIQATGCKNRKYTLRILNKPQTPEALLVVKGKAVKLKPSKPKPSNRTGKKSIPMRSSIPSASSGRSSGINAVEPKVRSSSLSSSASTCTSSLNGRPSALPLPSGISSCPSAQKPADWHRNPACPIPFIRSRDHQKNDNCFVEQKNGAVVRKYVGYDRLEGDALQESLTGVYRSLSPSSTSSCPP